MCGYGFFVMTVSSNSMNFRFLFPAVGGLLYGYDIGATSGAKISLQVCQLKLFILDSICFLIWW